MIDLHCHLDLYPDPEAVTRRAIAENIYVLAVTTTPLAWDGTRTLVGNGSRIRVAVGLHPELVAERASEVDLVCERIADSKYVGEVGLDGSPNHIGTLERQAEVFHRILDSCALHGGRILTIHSRGAASPVLDVLAAHPGAGKAVLHWFSGSRSELSRAIAQGCWFSVGPAMLRGKKGRDLAAEMPRDRVLTESDGPFARLGERPLFPWDVSQAVTILSEIWDIDANAAGRLVHSNFRNLLGERAE